MMIKLNVGGTVYATSSTTLCRYPDSMLARMIDGDIPTERDPDGAIFIDRDGNLFRFVLNFLRSGKLHLPESIEESLQLREEAEFYQIAPMIEALDARGSTSSSGAGEDASQHEDGWFVEVSNQEDGGTAKVYGSISFFLKFVGVIKAKRPKLWASIDFDEDGLLGRMGRTSDKAAAIQVEEGFAFARHPEIDRYFDVPNENEYRFLFKGYSRMVIGGILHDMGCKLLGTFSYGIEYAEYTSYMIRDKWFVPNQALSMT